MNARFDWNQHRTIHSASRAAFYTHVVKMYTYAVTIVRLDPRS